jgi:SagB-type dehydrogenase family enzyme
MDRIFSQFLEHTAFDHLDKPAQMQGAKQPPLEAKYDKTKPVIELPPVSKAKLTHDSLREVMTERRTVRQYSPDPITLGELSFLLWCTQGIQETVPAYDGTGLKTMRTVPSAGARHAFDTFLLINNVEGVLPGLYRYVALGHKLVQLNTTAGLADLFVRGCRGQMSVKKSAAAFFWVADVYRMTWRFSQRGYRYLFLDAGHVCQNLYLGAGAVDCGACAIAAFDDDAMSRLLGIDGENRFVIYVGTVGRK